LKEFVSPYYKEIINATNNGDHAHF